MIPKDNVVVPVVQEFYTSLWDHESRNTKRHKWDTVLMRGKEKKQVCVGKRIHQKSGVIFLHLMTDLCKKAGVPMASIELLLKPS
ncbi:hypothetical protein J1N35_043789 [Gossypium stocksii]|uniref:Uncharacterized protein n=1 Tax=Gossypium stocksii TaxID=47602 RepID=A0A9D3U888_9ROSI|nr:hypothetical protein J1N35_043789 [Gossypium stocksii]